MNIAAVFTSMSKTNPRYIRNIIDLADIPGIEAANGVSFSELVTHGHLPPTVVAEFNDGSFASVVIDWLQGSYNPSIPGPVTLFGNIVTSGPITNNGNLQAQIIVTVGAITDFSPAFNVDGDNWVTRYYVNHAAAFVNTAQLWSPAIKRSPTTGKTYLMASRNPGAAPFGQIIVIPYDELQGVDEHYIVGQPLDDPETHQYPSMAITPAGVIKVTQEREHTTPIDVYSSGANEDHTVWSQQIALYGTALAYNNLFEDADGFTALCRGTGTDIYIAMVAHGDINFANWGSQIQISSATVGQNYRHYVGQPLNPTVGAWHYLLIEMRRDAVIGGNAEGIFEKILLLKTPKTGSERFKKYYNYFETQSFDIVATGRPFTGAEAIARYTVWSSNGFEQQAYIATACIDSNGRPYFIQSDGDPTKYFFIYEEGGVWISKLITGVSDVENRGYIQAGAYLFVVAYARDDVRAYVRRYTGSGSICHTWEIKTADLGDSWTITRNMTPDFAATQSAVLFIPANILSTPQNRNFPICIQTNGNNLLFKKSAFGAVQPYAAPEITPDANMAHASGLFDIAVENRTVSGSNVTGCPDAFGLRNPSIVGGVTYDAGENAIVLNGTTGYLSFATAGLTGLGAMTFICVIKGGGNKVLLSFSNNTSASRFYEITGGGNNTQWQISNSSAPVLTTVAGNKTDLSGSSNYHIIAVTVDGRVGGAVNIYIDDAKQPEIINATTIAMYNAIGRGTGVITGINAVRIGSRDQSGTDLFYAVRFKRMALYSSVLPLATLKAKMKFLANQYGITLNTQFA